MTMVDDMKVIGYQISGMERDMKYLVMDALILALLRKAKLVGREFSHGQTETFTTVNG